MATQENRVFLDIELCDEAVSVESNVAETDIIDLQVTKISNCPYAVVGGNICYTVTIVNNSNANFVDGALGGIIFRDPLASNLQYIPGTFQYTIGSGEPFQVEPNINADNVLTYDSIVLPAGQTAIVTFCVRVLSLPDNSGDN